MTPPTGRFHTLNKHELSEILAELTHPSETKTHTAPPTLAVLLHLTIMWKCYSCFWRCVIILTKELWKSTYKFLLPQGYFETKRKILCIFYVLWGVGLLTSH